MVVVGTRAGPRQLGGLLYDVRAQIIVRVYSPGVYLKG